MGAARRSAHRESLSHFLSNEARERADGRHGDLGFRVRAQGLIRPKPYKSEALGYRLQGLGFSRQGLKAGAAALHNSRPRL